MECLAHVLVLSSKPEVLKIKDVVKKSISSAVLIESLSLDHYLLLIFTGSTVTFNKFKEMYKYLPTLTGVLL